MQYPFEFETMPVAQARAVGQVAGELAEQRAARLMAEFSARAEAHILEQLAHGAITGEDLTDSCIAAGIKPSEVDARAFGSVIARLSTQKRIVCVRADLPRARGHGTSGGRLWRLA